MKKVFNFGKIAVYGTRKINAVDVEINLRDTKNGPEFAASAIVWNSKHTDAVMGGQCLDELLPYFSTNNTFTVIYKLHKAYHLNSMHAGTKAQEAAIDAWKAEGNRYDYTKACEYLKSINLYEDHGYRYGTSWLYEAIPDDDLAKIKALIGGEQ